MNLDVHTQLLHFETPLELRLSRAPVFQRGIVWGAPRPGHPEGLVAYHIREVLQNIEIFYGTHSNRARLRLIALCHDTLKFKRDDPTDETIRGKHHGQLAREWAERFIDDEGVLDVIELHDDCYCIYRGKIKSGNETQAYKEALQLIERLGPHLELYAQFYRCDNFTGDKPTAHYEWFLQVIETWGLSQRFVRTKGDEQMNNRNHINSFRTRFKNIKSDTDIETDAQTSSAKFRVGASRIVRVLLFVLTVLLLAAPPLHAAFLGTNGKIIFESSRGGDSEIYAINPDGTGLVNLTNNPANDKYPVVSPDGTKIAFVSDRPGNEEIYVMNVDGSNVTRLTNDSAVDRAPTWSPDGKRLAFASLRNFPWKIFTMDAEDMDQEGNGDNLKQLTNNSWSDYTPA